MIVVEAPRRQEDSAAARAARRQLFEQNSELRRLLALGLVEVYASAHGQPTAGPTLRALIQAIRAALVRHVSVEEGLLALHAQNLLASHDRQRRELEALSAAPPQGSDAALAERFDGLARDLLLDIAREETALVRGV
jgi:Hemerythrin HHE cation binding domain